MGYIQVLPEYGLVVDPMVGLVTTVGVSLGQVVERVDKLDKVADDIVNMLSGEGDFMVSFPGRGEALLYAGGVTAMWYGLAVGLFIAGIVAFGFL
jgi:tetrahydromethanopterin S-methyltransferase subunit B